MEINLKQSSESKQQDQGNQAIEIDDLSEIAINLNFKKGFDQLNDLSQDGESDSPSEEKDPFKMTGIQAKKLAEKQLNLKNLLPNIL